MKAQDRTEAQLLPELERLRLRVSELERGEVLRIQTENELRKSNEKLEAILNATTEFALLIDAEGTVLASNRPFAERLGTSVPELVGKHVFDFVEPPFSKRRQEQVAHVLNTGTPLRFEDERAGRILDHSLFPAFDRQGNVEGVAIFAQDVTEHKRAEEAAQGEIRKFQTLFEQAPCGMIMIGKDGTFRHINPKFTEMFGYDLRDVPDANRWFDLAYPDPDYRRAVISAWIPSEHGSGPGEPAARVLKVTCKNGTTKIVQFRGVTLHSGDSLLTCEDISDLKNTEEALRHREAMLQNILTSSPAAISYIENGRLAWTNPAMARMFHYLHESQYLGKMAKEFYDSTDEYERVLALFKKARQRKEPLETEASFRRSDGSTFYGQLKVNALDPADPRKGTISLIADVTDKTIAEELLRRSQERYRTLVEESFDGVLMHTGITITFANSRLHEMLGYGHGELAGLDHWVIYHPDYRQLVCERAQARLRGEPLPPRCEVKLQRRDGSVFDAELSARRVSFGADPGVQVWIKDITERKTAEAALRESEERFRKLSDAAEEGIIVHDRGRIVDANEACARMFGYDQSELIGMSTERLTTPESWDGISDHVSKGHDTPYEGLGLRKDGSTFWCHVVGKPYRLKGKTYRVSAIHDLTRRKKAEEALHRSREEYRILYEESKRAEDLYRSLLNSSADAVVVYDVNGRTQYVNDSFTAIFGWTIEDLRDSHIAYVPDSERDASMELILRLMEDGTPCRGFETKRFTKDGRMLDMSLSASRYHDHAGNPAGMLVVLRDITENKRLEEQLRQTTKMEAVGRLAGGIAHDFNNLLTAVIGYAHLLMQQLPPDSFQYEKLDQIFRAANRAAGLTAQLLAFSRRQLLDVKVLDINEVIRGVEEMLRRLIGEDIAFGTVLSSQLGRVKGDPGQIEQILMNLVVNSRDAMPLGGTLTIETANVFLDEEYARAHSEVHAGPYVMFAISDTGCGMDGETISRVFEPFFTTKEKGLGTGLGLATVYGIVKQHTGHVSVYSEANRGTTFKVYLPQVDDLPEPDSIISVKESRPTGTETILVVEDEETVRNLACEALELLGYSCLSACDPHEAKEIAASHEGPIQLLLTDVIMPVMDGRSLFTLLSPTRPEMKVLYTSGYTEDFIVHHGVLDTGVHFMQKPFSLDGLARKVRRVLDHP